MKNSAGRGSRENNRTNNRNTAPSPRPFENLEISWPVYSSLASRGKLNVFKMLHRTRICHNLGAIWPLGTPQTIPTVQTKIMEFKGKKSYIHRKFSFIYQSTRDEVKTVLF